MFRKKGLSTARKSYSYDHGYRAADFVLGLASPGAFPCPEASPSYNVQFSTTAGDGHYLAFGTEWGNLVIVDTRAEASVQRDHNGPIGSGAAAAAAGAAAAGRAGAGGGGGSLGWGVGQPVVVAEYRALINCIFDLEWTHGDRRIVLACGDGKCRVQDIETHAEVLVLSGHSGSVKAISANPLEHSVLLSGSRDGSFALWDTRLHQDKPESRGLHRTTAAEYLALATGPANRLQNRFLAPLEQVYRANIPAGNHRKRPWSYVGEAEAKPAKSKNFHLDLPCQSSVTAVEWMPDGQKFLTAGQDGLVKLWDTRYALRPLQAASPALDAAPAGRNTDADPATSPSSPAPPPTPWGLQPANSCAALGGSGSGGRRLAAAAAGGATRSRRKGRGGDGAGGSDRWRAYGRVSGGDAVAEEAASDGRRPYGVSSVHACDDGSRIAVCTVKNHISVYAYASGGLRPVGAFTGNENNSSYYIKAKLSPDGSLLASGASNDVVCLWQVDCPGAPIGRLKGHANEVTGVDWCRSERLKLASCSDDETVRVWTLDPLLVARCKSSPAGPHCRRKIGDDPGAAAPARAGAETAEEDTAAAAGDNQSGGASGRGSASGAGHDGDIENDGAIQGKFGRGVACIGESGCWTRWTRREPGGAARPTGVAGATPPRCTPGAAPGSSSEGCSGKDRSADCMDLFSSPTPASSDALSGAPDVAGAAGSSSASGASGKSAAWRGFSVAALDESVANAALVTADFGGVRSSVALDFFPPVGSGSTQVFSPCSPNKKAGIKPLAHAEGGAAAGGDVSDSGIVPREAGRRDGTNGANCDENAAPPLLGGAPADPHSASETNSGSRNAAPSSAEPPVPSQAGAAAKHPYGTSGCGINSAEAAMLRQQSVLAPPGGTGDDARQGSKKPAGLDFLRSLPSSARAAGSGWHGRGGTREWRQQWRQQQQQQQQQPLPQQPQQQQQQQQQQPQQQQQQQQPQQLRRQSLRLGSRRRISYVEGAPLRSQHPTLMAFWNGAQAQGGSSNEASGKAQGGSDRMTSSS